MELNFPTIACVNGHGFGVGFFWALACDFRIMRTGKGFLSFPELKIGLGLSHGFAASVRDKIPKHVQVKAGLLSWRFTAEDALKNGVIDAACPVEDLIPEARKLIMTFPS